MVGDFKPDDIIPFVHQNAAISQVKLDRKKPQHIFKFDLISFIIIYLNNIFNAYQKQI